MTQRPRTRMRGIRGTTRVIAILGDPVEHSRSPAMHNAAFAALGLDYVYVALRVASDDLPRAVAGVRGLGFAGLNVTVPHKEAIVPLLDRLSPAARAIGAVNTVVRQGDALVGHNTDGEGFRRSLRGLGFRGRGKSAIVLGAGGSARAVCWALAEDGVSEITILNRNLARARTLARRVGHSAGPTGRAVRLGDSATAAVLGDVDLVVNCTSLGLDGTSMPPIAIARTKRSCLVYDLVYGRRPTPLVRAAIRGDRRASDGLEMLLEQARLAFRIWTGRDAPRNVMARALRRRS